MARLDRKRSRDCAAPRPHMYKSGFPKEKPRQLALSGFRNKSLAMSYSHMGVSHDRTAGGCSQRGERRARGGAAGPQAQQGLRSAAAPHMYKSGFPKEKPRQLALSGFRNKSLAMSYSPMGKPHTTIGAEQFHF